MPARTEEEREEGWEWAQWRMAEGRFMLGVTEMGDGSVVDDFTGDGDPYCDWEAK